MYMHVRTQYECMRAMSGGVLGRLSGSVFIRVSCIY